MDELTPVQRVHLDKLALQLTPAEREQLEELAPQLAQRDARSRTNITSAPWRTVSTKLPRATADEFEALCHEHDLARYHVLGAAVLYCIDKADIPPVLMEYIDAIKGQPYGGW